MSTVSRLLSHARMFRCVLPVCSAVMPCALGCAGGSATGSGQGTTSGAGSDDGGGQTGASSGSGAASSGSSTGCPTDFGCATDASAGADGNGVADASSGANIDSGADARGAADGGSAGDGNGVPDAGCVGSACAIPIKHVIVIVKENHTFDNYFGAFPGAEGTLTSGGPNVCRSSKGPGPCARAPDAPTHDMCHGHDCGIIDWDQGKMDGWNQPGGSDTGDDLVYAQYGEQEIPNYWAYARHFALGDHYFADVLSPSLPGHMFTVAAQAGWATDNPPTDLPGKLVPGPPPMFYGPHPYWGCDEWPGDTVPILAGGVTPAKVFPCFNIPSIPDVLPTGVDWKYYGTNFDGFFSDIWSPFDAIQGIRKTPSKWARVVIATQLTTDIKNHTLPGVSWLVDQDQYSEHPDVMVPGLKLPLGGVCVGENWTVDYINQLMASDYWKDTAILFTMDDYGGWYDHVPPPRQYGGTASAPYGLGFRLPLLIISPYAKPGSVFKEVSETASIARFIERVFGASMTLHDMDPAAQDGQANDLFGAFDFSQQPLPPLALKTRTCP